MISIEAIKQQRLISRQPSNLVFESKWKKKKKTANTQTNKLKQKKQKTQTVSKEWPESFSNSNSVSKWSSLNSGMAVEDSMFYTGVNQVHDVKISERKSVMFEYIIKLWLSFDNSVRFCPSYYIILVCEHLLLASLFLQVEIVQQISSIDVLICFVLFFMSDKH